MLGEMKCSRAGIRISTIDGHMEVRQRRSAYVCRDGEDCREADVNSTGHIDTHTHSLTHTHTHTSRVVTVSGTNITKRMSRATVCSTLLRCTKQLSVTTTYSVISVTNVRLISAAAHHGHRGPSVLCTLQCFQPSPSGGGHTHPQRYMAEHHQL